MLRVNSSSVIFASPGSVHLCSNADQAYSSNIKILCSVSSLPTLCSSSVTMENKTYIFKIIFNNGRLKMRDFSLSLQENHAEGCERVKFSPFCHKTKPNGSMTSSVNVQFNFYGELLIIITLRNYLYTFH